ncbi:MAG: hypothetical protein ACE145_13370 [Terriglobia bacterium]
MTKRLTTQFVFPSLHRPGNRVEVSTGNDRGWALVILMMMTVLILISLTAAVPSVYTAGMREREEELIFRGNEYARAIVLFRRQFRRYPTSVKELLETNGIHFLRREYSDPMTAKGKWRFIHADAAGTPLDSRTLARPKPPSALGSDSSSSQEKKQEAPSAGKIGRFESGEEGQPKETSAFFDKGVQGAFIIGVASMSNKQSIRVWNNKTRYSDWEFIGVDTPGGGAVPGQANPPPGGGQQPPSIFGPGGRGDRTFPTMPPLTGPAETQ